MRLVFLNLSNLLIISCFIFSKFLEISGDILTAILEKLNELSEKINKIDRRLSDMDERFSDSFDLAHQTEFIKVIFILYFNNN